MPRRGRWSHSDAPSCILYGESRVKYTIQAGAWMTLPPTAMRAAAGEGGVAYRRARQSHCDDTLYVLYRESLMRYTGRVSEWR